MTSKEALERYYSNLNYGVGGFQTDEEELEALNTIKQDLERLEQLEQAQDLKIESLQSIETETKYQVAIRVLKEAFIALGKSDITDTCWFKFLEELEKENEELKKQNKIYLQRQNKLLDKLIICRQQIKVLLKENQELKMQKNSTMLLMKLMSLDGNIVESALILDKYRKAIEWLKENLNFKIEKHKSSPNCMFVSYKDLQEWLEPSNEIVDLLKEVLGNE